MTDKIYGSVEINSPVLCELIQSAPLLRMQGISQLGLPDRYFHKRTFNRFDHCVGTMLLLRRLGASEEEQIAGLLHDVSHSAFSHVIDWVVGDGVTEDYADLTHAKYLLQTEVPLILKRHSFDLGRIADCHQFGLLERDAPDLCADRVDYTLRELYSDGTVIDFGIDDFISLDGQIAMHDQKSALGFAQSYLNLQITNWGHFESANRYRMIAHALKRAMGIGILQFADLWRDDEYCLNRLETKGDKEILKMLKRLNRKSLSEELLTGQRVHKKFRFVDPLFLCDGQLLRLSDSHEDFRRTLELARQENAAGVAMVKI